LLYVGDCDAARGHGEFSRIAIEQRATATYRSTS
jgi:acetamidase/formamidase